MIMRWKQLSKGLGDLKSPGIDGYASKFSKASWHTIKVDVMRVISDFFEKGKLYKVVNYTVVTLIPKSEEAKSIRDYRPIAGCSTLYKIIPRILTCRLARVIGSVISSS